MESLYSEKSLKDHNTFGINVMAEYFYEFSDVSELRSFIKQPFFHDLPRLILGKGSNILFTKNFKGIVINPLIKGIEKIQENNDAVFVRSGAGENWDDLVEFCVSNEYGGLENLSMIPGTVGAAPVQNIGAYGAEARDYIYEVETFNLDTFEIEHFENKSCKFSYRDSIFKNELKNKNLVTNVIFKFDKVYRANTSYGNIRSELQKINGSSISDIRKIIMKIRSEKLPDPSIIGNAGSFFKNPLVDDEKTGNLIEKFPGLPLFKSGNLKNKISAAWMIEKCGWKGKLINNAGVYKNQALVIVNNGNATGSEILHLSEQIQRSVFEKFEINLEPEVNIY